MSNTPFNPNQQEKDISSKIVAGLERISEVFKILLWEKAKLIGLSPIQIQLLIFIKYHQQNLCNVSHLSREFNVTKPTISDAIRILDKKAFILKDYSSSDNRSYTIQLTESGNEIVNTVEDFSTPLKKQVDLLSVDRKENLFQSISQIIYQLNQNEVLNVQRTCYGCVHYQKESDSDYCNLLQKPLKATEIRIDCPEYQAR